MTYSVDEFPKDLKCSKCEARLLGIVWSKDEEAVKLVKKKIKGTALTTEENKKFERIMKTADLFLVYREKTPLALAARGVGPEMAKRILAKFHDTQDSLFFDLLAAEKNYYKTRKFWQA